MVTRKLTCRRRGATRGEQQLVTAGRASKTRNMPLPRTEGAVYPLPTFIVRATHSSHAKIIIGAFMILVDVILAVEAAFLVSTIAKLCQEVTIQHVMIPT